MQTARSARSGRESRFRRPRFGRVGAQHLASFGGLLRPEQDAGLPNRLLAGHRLVERRERDHATELRVADRHAGMCLKSPPIPVLPFLTSTLPPIRIADSEQLADRRLGVDHLGDHRSQHERRPANGRSARTRGRGCTSAGRSRTRSRRRQTGSAGSASSSVCPSPIPASVTCRYIGANTLAVLRVARRLVERDRALLGVDRQVRVAGLLAADRRVDVEAVDRRVA